MSVCPGPDDSVFFVRGRTAPEQYRPDGSRNPSPNPACCLSASRSRKSPHWRGDTAQTAPPPPPTNQPTNWAKMAQKPVNGDFPQKRKAGPKVSTSKKVGNGGEKLLGVRTPPPPPTAPSTGELHVCDFRPDLEYLSVPKAPGGPKMAQKPVNPDFPEKMNDTDLGVGFERVAQCEHGSNEPPRPKMAQKIPAGAELRPAPLRRLVSKLRHCMDTVCCGFFAHRLCLLSAHHSPHLRQFTQCHTRPWWIFRSSCWAIFFVC